MADLNRIKNNVAKMASMNAPEADIDGYISSEGVSIEDVKNFKSRTSMGGGMMGGVTPQDIISGMLPIKLGDILSEGVKGRAKEVISPLMGQVSPERLPIPKSVADIGFRAGAMAKPESVLGKIALEMGLDPRTYLPTTAIPKVRKPLDILLKASQKAIQPSAKPGFLAKVGAFGGGVETEDLIDVAKLGYRNVLQKKYYNRKLPEMIQGKIENNIGNLWESAGNKFKQVSEGLRNSPFWKEGNELKELVGKMWGKIKKNPIKGASRNLDRSIYEGFNNYQINNVGDVLDFRRFLDEAINTSRGQGTKSNFALDVRKSFNDILHKKGNPITEKLAEADEEWTNLQRVLEDVGDKVTSVTGENFLSRIRNLTGKQKEQLIRLEQEIGGEPFFQDLTRWGLAQKFRMMPGMGVWGTMRQLEKPLLRGALRTGGGIQNIRKIIGGGTR